MRRYEVSGFEVLEYNELESTNTIVAGFSPNELKDKEVVLTWRQTGGRGQATNKWESAAEQNISMTVVCQPMRLEAGKQFAISMVIALGCLDFVGRYVKDVSVKWPNDVYVGDRKIAGILIEHRVAGMYLESSLCGIGMNINQKEFVSDALNPVSLFQLIGRELVLADALEELLACIDRRYVCVNDYSLLEDDFRRYMYRGTGVFDWEDAEGCFRAAVFGLDEYGQLLLEDSNGWIRTYAFKEVKYV